jgi:type II secretory pathway component PulM
MATGVNPRTTRSGQTHHDYQLRKGEMEMTKFSQVLGAVVLVTVIAVQPAWAASTKEELEALRTEVQGLKEGQAEMQKDLADIKKLLEQGARAAPSQPAFKPADVTIDD